MFLINTKQNINVNITNKKILIKFIKNTKGGNYERSLTGENFRNNTTSIDFL